MRVTLIILILLIASSFGVEGYRKVIGRMQPLNDSRTKLILQDRIDVINDEFTPLTGVGDTESSPLGMLHLDTMIYNGISTTLFTGKEFPNLLIKYQAHCVGTNSEVHPLLKDVWYMNETNRLGISPRVHFISPPSDLCETQGGTCAFTMSSGDWENCQSKQSALRYMIMDRLDGVSLWQFQENNFGFLDVSNAMVIGYYLIETLRKLHIEARVVHGDIYSRNVIIQTSNSTQACGFDLKLIDFETAFRYPESPLSKFPIRKPYSWSHSLLTRWQMDGFAWAARDDIIKAIQTVAHLMHPPSYANYEDSLIRAGSKVFRRWKMLANWFLTPSRDPVDALPISSSGKQRIYSLLEQILEIGRGMRINGPLPYQELMNAMSECGRIARGLSTAESSSS